MKRALLFPLPALRLCLQFRCWRKHSHSKPLELQLWQHPGRHRHRVGYLHALQQRQLCREHQQRDRQRPIRCIQQLRILGGRQRFVSHLRVFRPNCVRRGQRHADRDRQRLPQTAALSGTGGSGGSCTTTPSAPTGLAASGTTSSGTNLSWTADTPPTNCTISSYTVLKNGTSIGTATGTTFAVTGLTASTSYSFTVEATDS